MPIGKTLVPCQGGRISRLNATVIVVIFKGASLRKMPHETLFTFLVLGVAFTHLLETISDPADTLEFRM